MNKLSQFFQDDNDRFSATRLAFLSWIFGVLIIWGVGSFHDKKMQDIPSSIQVLIGVLMTGKVVQKFSEVSGSTATADKPAIEKVNTAGPNPVENGLLTSSVNNSKQ